LRRKHPFQDGPYLALAERLKAPLVTADPKFFERTAGLYTRVTPLVAEFRRTRATDVTPAATKWSTRHP
jgi:hypothetical protein